MRFRSKSCKGCRCNHRLDFGSDAPFFFGISGFFLLTRRSRDELGLGAVRDSIADHLFPGTSTIQTRLRYMLFIPWLFRTLEGRDVPESQL